MKKINFIFKMMIPVLIGVVMSMALAGCSKDKDDDSNLAPVGTIAPPEWLLGTWELGYDKYEVVADNITVGMSGFVMDLKSMVDMANDVMEGFTAKMKEIKKTDVEYEVGMETKMSGGPTSTDSYYRFKKGDGTYIEVSEYDQDEKWKI